MAEDNQNSNSSDQPRNVTPPPPPPPIRERVKPSLTPCFEDFKVQIPQNSRFITEDTK